AVAEAVEANVEVNDATQEEQPKQRRNRRSPRHLRASGQRRRRGRDRRPNPFRLRKGGVASPEMAMGKVMPRYDLAKPKRQSQAQPVEPVVETSAIKLSGFAMPEMAMGKIILCSTAKANTDVKVEAPVKLEAPVVAEVKEVAAKVVEANVAPETKTEPPVNAETVAPVEKVETIATPQEASVDSPKLEETKPEEAKFEETKLEETTVNEEVAVTTETVTQVQPVVGKTGRVKAHATSAMTKAPGPQEIKEIEVVSMPLKTERYQAKGAGSQVARSQAGSGMTKPQGF
ncbi:ribonuclease E, partial [Vibrio genomosp. F10 str. 9ZC157]